MNQTDKCPECGAELPASAPRGLCPGCLLKRGLETNTIGYTAEDAPAARWTPPSVEELAARFPELEITRLIGRGGMGAVYQARQKSLDRVVALKILPPEIGQDPAFTQRFATEAQAMAKLNHPHIVTIYEFGERAGWYYFIMEYVDGLSLRGLLDSGHVSPKEALAIVPQICDALQYAHEQGIVHRDIKPENILLNKQGQVKIADFGLAKLMGRTTEASPGYEKIMGTPQYMAPEQLNCPAEVDHRADIYSLGVVFYQMLTGELPTGQLVRPSRKVLIDVRLDEVVLRALEKEPEKRYQQVSQVRTEVETIAETSAAPPSQPAAHQEPPGVNIDVDVEWNKPKFSWRYKKNIPLLGTRNGRRVIYLPGLLASTLITTIAFYAGLGLAALLFKGIFGYTIPGSGYIFAAIVPLMIIAYEIRQILKIHRRPIDQLPALDAPPSREPGAQLPGRARIGNLLLSAARINGTIWIAILLIVLLKHGLPLRPQAPMQAFLVGAAMAFIVGGFIVGWFRTGAAARLVLMGWFLFHGSDESPHAVWPIDLAGIIGLLYLAAEWGLSPPTTWKTTRMVIGVVGICTSILGLWLAGLFTSSGSYAPSCHITWTTTGISDVQPDGTIHSQGTTETGNLTDSTWKTREFVSSDFCRLEKITDRQGRPIPFTVQHDEANHLYRYKLALLEPVPPGQTFTENSEWTINSLIKPTGEPGVLEYHMNHWPAINGDTFYTDVYRLPARAQLLEKSPSDLTESNVDGRIELRISRVIPPGGNIEVRFLYRFTLSLV